MVAALAIGVNLIGAAGGVLTPAESRCYMVVVPMGASAPTPAPQTNEEIENEKRKMMTHEDAGHYAAKHPPGTRPDPVVAEAVLAEDEDGLISCHTAHRIARDLGVSPAVVGTTIDLLEKRIARCQLGLFGYSPRRKILQPADSVAPELAQTLNRLAVEGGISCRDCWDTAAALGMPRMAVAAACDRLGLKIRPCQLGAF